MNYMFLFSQEDSCHDTNILEVIKRLMINVNLCIIWRSTVNLPLYLQSIVNQSQDVLDCLLLGDVSHQVQKGLCTLKNKNQTWGWQWEEKLHTEQCPCFPFIRIRVLKQVVSLAWIDSQWKGKKIQIPGVLHWLKWFVSPQSWPPQISWWIHSPLRRSSDSCIRMYQDIVRLTLGRDNTEP